MCLNATPVCSRPVAANRPPTRATGSSGRSDLGRTQYPLPCATTGRPGARDPHSALERLMPDTNATLHGSAPDTPPVALLLVDVINPLDFPESDQLLRH